MDRAADPSGDRALYVVMHWPFLVLLGIGIVLRAIAMVAYRPILLLQSDGYVYLQKAIDLEPAQLRPVFYSFFLRPFIEVHSLTLLAGAQHLLGIGMAVLLYVALARRGVGRGWAAASTVPLLLDGYQLNIEHYLLSETLFQALVVAAVVLLTWSDRLGLAAAAAAGLLLAAAALTRFIGLVGIAIAFLYLLLYKRNLRSLVVFSISVLVPLLLYAAWFSSFYGTFALTNRGGYFLYGRVAPFAECDWNVPKTQRVLCDTRDRADRPGHNHYVFSSDSPIERLEVPHGRTRNEVLNDFSLGVIMHEPGRYLGTVGADVLHTLSPFRYTGPKDARLDLWRFPRRSDVLRDRAFLVRRHQASPPPVVDETRFRIAPDAATFLRAYQSLVYLYGPLLLLFLIAAVTGWLKTRGRDRHGGDALFFAAMGTALMLVPFFTINFDYRFITPAVPLLPPAAALGLTALTRAGTQAT
ncbi:MAG: hypothetical protein GEU78_01660 [Actinobacteria bacterium]|nr:hypothetical protein [Actinomycetota bacterium]